MAHVCGFLVVTDCGFHSQQADVTMSFGLSEKGSTRLQAALPDLTVESNSAAERANTAEADAVAAQAAAAEANQRAGAAEAAAADAQAAADSAVHHEAAQTDALQSRLDAAEAQATAADQGRAVVEVELCSAGERFDAQVAELRAALDAAKAAVVSGAEEATADAAAQREAERQEWVAERNVLQTAARDAEVAAAAAAEMTDGMEQQVSQQWASERAGLEKVYKLAKCNERNAQLQ